jgi:hypothetical protein
MISFGIEAEAPILKLFLERSVCAPSIYQLNLHFTHGVFFSILNFILLLICMCYFNN